MLADTDEIRNLLINYPDTLVVVDCFAKWCGPCKMIAPQVERLEEEYGRRIIVRKVDVDVCPDFAEMCQVGGMPTFLFYKHKKEINRVVGANMEQVHKTIQHFI